MSAVKYVNGLNVCSQNFRYRFGFDHAPVTPNEKGCCLVGKYGYSAMTSVVSGRVRIDIFISSLKVCLY